jgi:acetyl-CoA carboxylase biotin carboxyl carrier protein
MTGTQIHDLEDSPGRLHMADPLGDDLAAQNAVDALVRAVNEVVTATSAPPRRVTVKLGCASIDVDWTTEPPPTPAPAMAMPFMPGMPGMAMPGAGAALWGHAEPPVAPDPVVAPPPAPAGHPMTAPLVGTFYHAPEPGAPPFVAVGDIVQAGQQIGIVEAMKLMNPIEANRAGRVVEVLAGDGEPVEYGQPLVLLEPAEEQ